MNKKINFKLKFMETIKVQMKEKELKTDSTLKKTTKKFKGKNL